MASSTLSSRALPVSGATETPLAVVQDLADVYATHFKYVWRCLRGLGVPAASLDDAVQEVFLVVQRKLADFDGGAELRTWLYAIVLRVARRHRVQAVRDAHRFQLNEASNGDLKTDAAEGANADLRRDVEHNERLALAQRALQSLDDVKREVFHQLDRVMRPGAVLATNTSTLDLDAIAGFTRRPSDVLGLHFFSPANVMRLLEVVRGRETSPDVLITNYSMLEYMMMRPIGRSIFDRTRTWLASNPDERFIVVLDEAHLYRGAPGAEVGLLMRRLRSRLNLNEERFQVICSTASFSNVAQAGEFTAQAGNATQQGRPFPERGAPDFAVQAERCPHPAPSQTRRSPASARPNLPASPPPARVLRHSPMRRALISSPACRCIGWPTGRPPSRCS